MMLKTDAPPAVNCELVMVLLGTDDIVPEVALRLQVVDEPHRILLVFPCEDTVNVHHSAQQKSFAMLQKTMRAKRILETGTVQHFPHTFVFFCKSWEDFECSNMALLRSPDRAPPSLFGSFGRDATASVLRGLSYNSTLQ